MRERRIIRETFLLARYINLLEFVECRGASYKIIRTNTIASSCYIVSLLVICSDPRILVLPRSMLYTSVGTHYITNAIDYLSDFSRMVIYYNGTEKMIGTKISFPNH